MRLKTSTLFPLLGVAAALATACQVEPANGQASGPTTPDPSAPPTRFAIHVFAGGQSLELGPVQELAVGGPSEPPGEYPQVDPLPAGMLPPGTSIKESVESRSAPHGGPGASTNDVDIETPDGGRAANGADPTIATGWALVAGAAFECGIPVVAQRGGSVAASFVVPPWHKNVPTATPWYIFPTAPQSCDDVLVDQQSA
jgi:hypothetical protein